MSELEDLDSLDAPPLIDEAAEMGFVSTNFLLIQRNLLFVPIVIFCASAPWVPGARNDFLTFSACVSIYLALFMSDERSWTRLFIILMTLMAAALGHLIR